MGNRVSALVFYGGVLYIAVSLTLYSINWWTIFIWIIAYFIVRCTELNIESNNIREELLELDALKHNWLTPSEIMDELGKTRCSKAIGSVPEERAKRLEYEPVFGLLYNTVNAMHLFEELDRRERLEAIRNENVSQKQPDKTRYEYRIAVGGGKRRRIKDRRKTRSLTIAHA